MNTTETTETTAMLSATDLKRVLEARLKLNLDELVVQAEWLAQRATRVAEDAKARNAKRISDGLLTPTMERVDSLSAQISVLRDTLAALNGEGM